MAGTLWIVNYLAPFPLEEKVGRILSETKPPGSNRLMTALVEISGGQVNRLRHQQEVISMRPVSTPLESSRCVAVTSDGLRCGRPAAIPDPLWGGLICDEHASMGERMRHQRKAERLLETIDDLSRQMEDAIAKASRAREEGEQTSVLVAELLLGVCAHLSSGKETLQLARSSLQDALRELE